MRQIDHKTQEKDNEVPWKEIGVSIADETTTDQMLKKANLDWTVDKVPLYATIGWPEKTVQAEHFLLVRSTDMTILDEVTDSWLECQNSEAFDTFNSIATSGDMKMEFAGSLKNGKIVWALAKMLNKTFTLFGGDHIDLYMLFSNPHQFGQIISYNFLPIRQINYTTLAMLTLNSKDEIPRLTHRKKFNEQSVKLLLEHSTAQLNLFKQFATIIGNKKIKHPKVAENYFQKVFPSTREKKYDIFYDDNSLLSTKCMNIYETQPGSEFAPGSYWQAWNAVTFFLDHHAGRSIDNRLSSSWFGTAKKTKINAFQLAYDMSINS